MGKGILVGFLVIIFVVVGLGVILLQGNGSGSDNSGANNLNTGDLTQGTGSSSSGGDTSSSSTSSSTSSSSSSSSSSGGSSSLVVEMSSSGFSPSTLNIDVGETVTFTNVGSTSIWPASAVHPTHTVYPGSDINKCGTAEESLTFDSCGDVAPGDSYSFTFNEVGSWDYHDHRRASRKGTIVVS